MGSEIWSAVTRAALRAGRGTAFWLAYIKAASRGIPLAAALQIHSPGLRVRKGHRSPNSVEIASTYLSSFNVA